MRMMALKWVICGWGATHTASKVHHSVYKGVLDTVAVPKHNKGLKDFIGGGINTRSQTGQEDNYWT